MSNDKKLLEELNVFVNKLNTTNKSNAKLEILKELDSPLIRKVLNYVYNPYFNYWIKPKSCIKLFEDNVTASSTTLFDLLDDLKDRKYTGHDAIHKFNSYVKENSEYQELIFKILGRDLKTRVGISQINKIYPKCVPTFEVCLAQKLTDKLIEKTDFCDGWFISKKLDGLRCVIKFDNGEWKAYSRAGKEFKTMGNLLKYITENFSAYKDMVFDGEICIVDENGKEDFNAIASEYNKKDYTIENPKFIMFDVISKVSFDNEEGVEKFKDRYKFLKDNFKSSQYITVLEQFLYTEQLFIDKKIEVEEEGFEGLMLRNGNAPYNAGRNKDLLKVKKFHDEEYKIVGYEVGPFRVIEDGREVEIETVVSIDVEMEDGNRCGVGSGFSLDERKELYKNPDALIGKIATIKYFEKTLTNGKISLRFPTLKKIYENDRDA